MSAIIWATTYEKIGLVYQNRKRRDHVYALSTL